MHTRGRRGYNGYFGGGAAVQTDCSFPLFSFVVGHIFIIPKIGFFTEEKAIRSN